MKRLFETMTGVFFDNKQDAKSHAKAHGLTVSKGPDHWKKGVMGNPTTHTNSGLVGTGFPRKVR